MEGGIGQGNVAIRCSAEHIESADAKRLLCSEQFAFEFVVDDGRDQNAASAFEHPRKPFRNGGNLGSLPGMGDQSKWAGVEKNEPAYG